MTKHETEYRLPERLRKAMELKKMTQADLADKIGGTRQKISRYITGASAPPADVLFSISKALDVSPDYLLGIADDATTDIKEKYMCEYTGLSSKSINILHNLKNSSDCIPKLRFLEVLNRIIEKVLYDGKAFDHLKSKDMNVYTWGAGQSILYVIWSYIDAQINYMSLFNSDFGDINPDIMDEIRIDYGNGKCVFLDKSTAVMNVLERQIIRRVEELAEDTNE